MINNEVSNNSVINSKAIASLILGILSILMPFIGFVLGIIGIILSRMATKEINKAHEKGRGLATAGLICSIVGVIFDLLVVISIIAFIFVVDVESTTIQFLFM